MGRSFDDGTAQYLSDYRSPPANGPGNILLAVCEYENAKTALGAILDKRGDVEYLTERLHELGATMSDAPSPEKLASWAFPWL
jgi:hypothetical protein